MDKVGLDPRFAGRYPHELSGGQRHASTSRARSHFVRAWSSSMKQFPPSTSRSKRRSSTCCFDLKHEFGLTYVFISHDLNVVRYISDRVMVMYLGEIVEIGPVEAIYRSPSIPIRAHCWRRCHRWIPTAHAAAAALRRSAKSAQPTGRLPLAYPLSVRRARLRAGLEPLTCRPSGHLAACHMMVPGSGHSRARGGAHERAWRTLGHGQRPKGTLHRPPPVHAVNGVSFSLRRGEALGILGESGSGKSVTMKTLIADQSGASHADRRAASVRRRMMSSRYRTEPFADFRGRVVSMIFQDPMPRLRSGVYDRRSDRRNRPAP